ncbi:hypothetical protein FACS1894199_12500 [Bacteroidia bacterium]|nr:hypothetical protein FACS1894199_12500 [Bacteroidia bacterium]
MKNKIEKLFVICAFIGVFVGIVPALCAQSVISGSVKFVKASPVGDSSGYSWGKACSLSAALDSARANKKIKQIWVAAGTYTPEYAPDGSTADSCDRAFLLVDSVKMYGGFVGTETDINQRPSVDTGSSIQTPSILSGKLGNNGSAYHVLVGVRLTKETLLDGFTVRGGNANGTDSIRIGVSPTDTLIVHRYNGGGIYLSNSSPTLTNLHINGNTANNGGGIYLSNSSPTLANLLIDGNTAKNGGGAIYSFSSNPKLINSFITNNSAKKGSALYSHSISITVSPNTSTLLYGQRDTLVATVLPAGVNAPVAWSSANPQIATVVKISADSAVVTAGAVIGTIGTTHIYATAGGISDTCTVTVPLYFEYHDGSGWTKVGGGISISKTGSFTFKVRAILLSGVLPTGFDQLQWSFSPSAPQKTDGLLTFDASTWNSGNPVSASTEMTITATGSAVKNIYVWNCKSDGTRGTISATVSVSVAVSP